MRAYKKTDKSILVEIGGHSNKGGSTAVTVILIDGIHLLVANVGDSRAILSRDGKAFQLSVDHDPIEELETIESRGGFVSKKPGDVPRVDGKLAMSRAFGDKSIKEHISSKPKVIEDWIYDTDEFLILASDGLWKVMDNQEAIDIAREVEDPKIAAKHLTKEAIKRGSQDDISCIVVKLG